VCVCVYGEVRERERVCMCVWGEKERDREREKMSFQEKSGRQCTHVQKAGDHAVDSGNPVTLNN
jgi:hypothetical protein